MDRQTREMLAGKTAAERVSFAEGLMARVADMQRDYDKSVREVKFFEEAGVHKSLVDNYRAVNKSIKQKIGQHIKDAEALCPGISSNKESVK